MSLSDDGKVMGRPTGFRITVRELRPSLGAGFIVALTGKVLTMQDFQNIQVHQTWMWMKMVKSQDYSNVKGWMKIPVFFLFSLKKRVPDNQMLSGLLVSRTYCLRMYKSRILFVASQCILTDILSLLTPKNVSSGEFGSMESKLFSLIFFSNRNTHFLLLHNNEWHIYSFC